MRKIINPWKDKEGYDCFGCAPKNPIGLHMEFFEDGDEVISFWRPQQHFQGWISTMHGGILATLIDETAAWVIVRKLQTTGVTAKLNIRYKHEVLTTDTQITVRAHITEQKRNLVTVAVTVENGASEVCVEAEAVYFTVSQDKAHELGFTHCDVEDDQLLSM